MCVEHRPEECCKWHAWNHACNHTESSAKDVSSEQIVPCSSGSTLSVEVIGKLSLSSSEPSTQSDH